MAFSHAAARSKASISRAWRRSIQARGAAAERQRRETAEQLSTITANIPSAVFRFHIAADQAQRFSFISAHVIHLCGLPAERILEDPQALQDLLSREHQDQLQRACRLSLENGGEEAPSEAAALHWTVRNDREVLASNRIVNLRVPAEYIEVVLVAREAVQHPAVGLVERLCRGVRVRGA